MSKAKQHGSSVPAEESERHLKTDQLDHMDRIITSGSLDDPMTAQGPFGPMMFGLDLGAFGPKPREHQEDAIVVNTKAHAFAVIDGMGFYGSGRRASQIFSELMQFGFRSNKGFELVQQLAHRRMNKEGLGENGVCYFAVRIKEDQLEAGYAGDVQLAIYNSKGRPRFVSVPEGSGSMVENAVQGIHLGETQKITLDIFRHDRLILASDGLWSQISPDEVGEIISDLEITTALRSLWAELKRRMNEPLAHVDNVSIVFYDLCDARVLRPIPSNVLLRQAQSIDELLAIVEEIGGLPGVTCLELRRRVLALRDGRTPFHKAKQLPTALGFQYLVEQLLQK